MNQEILEKYELISEEPLPDVHGKGTYLRHKKSGAKVALISCADDNKVFSIAFRTPPKDSTGVAHILEHSVLCGSKHFPLKDPFVELAKGSLNTFLNAMTYPDRTVYPVASCNDKDFQNLMHVYLDAVFYPNIYAHEEIFCQEGWAYEIENKEDALSYNGVVYNEMKGVFSSPEGVLERQIMNSLYPDTAYGVESGGDPKVIPTLTYEQFLDFHRRYYHPSNAYIYLYGNMDMDEKLTFLDCAYLSAFSAIQVDSAVKKQTPFSAMRKLRLPYPVGEEEDTEEKTYLSWQKVVGDVCDIRQMLAFEVLDYCLISSSGSPLEKALLDAGIGKDVYGSLETDIREPYFSVVAKDAKEEQKEAFVRVLEEALKRQVKEGLSEKAVLAAINHQEFRVREADFGSYPKGLLYGLSMYSTWLHKEDAPFQSIQVLNHFAWLRTQVKTGYFEDLIQKALLDNPHGSVLMLTPQKGLIKEEEEHIENKLAAYKASLSEADLSLLVQKTANLRRYQQEEDLEENIKKLPLLSRADLKREIMPYTIKKEEGFALPTLRAVEETNGILYLQAFFFIRDLPKELIPFVSLLTGILGSIDTECFSYDEIPHEVNLHTGGIESDVGYTPKEDGDALSYFKISAKAFYQEMPALFSLITEILLHSKMDSVKRLQELLAQYVSRLQMGLQTAGHVSALIRSSAYHDEGGRFAEYTKNIAFYRILTDLSSHFSERKEAVIRLLTDLCRILFTGERAMIYVNADPRDFPVQTLREEERRFADNLYKKEEAASLMENACALAKEELRLSAAARWPKGNEAFTGAMEVQYVARTGSFSTKRHPYTGAMQILRTILNYEYLWNHIRVQGGAYGCMSKISRTGLGYFLSYRDPHLMKTNKTFNGIADYLAHFQANEREMTRYIIGTLSGMDAPLSAQQKGDRALTIYLTGQTAESLQKERDEVLDCTAEDIRALALPVGEILDGKHMCVIGGEEKIKRAAAHFAGIEPLL